MINEIFEFNRELLGVQPKTVPYLEHKHAMFNVKAIREEAQELADQHMKFDDSQQAPETPIIYSDAQSEESRVQTVKSVDAGIDAAYFAIGLLARAGLTVEQAIECFLAVDTANKTKKKGVVASRGDMGVADATKPADFVPPDVQIYKILFSQEPSEKGLELLNAK